VLFSMISIPVGMGDIPSVWYPLFADDICLRHMEEWILYHIRLSRIYHAMLASYIISRKRYIIKIQQCYESQALLFCLMRNNSSRTITYYLCTLSKTDVTIFCLTGQRRPNYNKGEEKSLVPWDVCYGFSN